MFIVRQPVFDRAANVWAHEFLYQGEPDGPPQEIAPAALLRQVVQDGASAYDNPLKKTWTVVSMSCDSLRACPEGLGFNGSHAVTLTAPASGMAMSPGDIDGIKDNGSKLILDSAVPQDVFASLRDHADTIRLSLNGLTPREVILFRQRMKDYQGTLLAADIATWEDYQGTRALGFDYFQGPFFTRPLIHEGREMNASGMAKLQLLRELNAPETDMGRLADVIATDVSLSYRLLRYINSAAFGLPNKIKSIQQAVSLLGLQEVRRWSMVIVMNDLDASPKGEELAYMALQRARFLEQMAETMPALNRPGAELFLLGLFSRLDALLSHDMEKVLADIPLDTAIKQALCGGRGDELGDMLEILDAVEVADWSTANGLLAKYQACFTTAATQYLKASSWASRQVAHIG